MYLILPGAIFVAVGLLGIIIIMALLLSVGKKVFLALSITDHYILHLDRLYKAESDMSCL